MKTSGTVYGDATLTTDFTIPEGYTLTVPSGATLTISSGVTLTVNGTLTIESGATVNNYGSICAENGTINGSCRPSPLWTASITITSVSSKTYDGDSISADYIEYTYTGYGTPTFTWYSDSGGSKASLLESAPSDVGTYWVGISAAQTDYFNAVSEVTKQFTITKVTSSVTDAPTANTLTYSGSEQALVTAGEADGGTMMYSLSDSNYSANIPTGTEVGDYTVYYKIIGDSNHNDSAVSSVTVTIAKAAPEVTAPKAKTLTYSGKAQALVTAGRTTGGTMVYSLTEEGEYSETVPTGKDIGEYTVYYKVNGDSNYNDSEVASVTVKIVKKSSSSGSSSAATTTPTSSDGTASGWSAITADISAASEGEAVTVNMNGTTYVPASVIAAIAESGAVVTFKVDDTYSWTIDGGSISGSVSSASLAVSEATVSADALNIPEIEGGISTVAFTLSGVDFSINPTLTASLGESASGKFANLYKLNTATGELEFVAVTKADAAGNAVIPVESDGTYVIVVDSETELPGDFDNDMTITVKDALLLLRYVVSGAVTYNYKADFDGNGKVDVFDAAAVLRTAVGLG